MARRKIPFVLSKKTDEEFQAALEQLAEKQATGWRVSDIRREEREQDGETVPVAIIEISNP